MRKKYIKQGSKLYRTDDEVDYRKELQRLEAIKSDIQANRAAKIAKIKSQYDANLEKINKEIKAFKSLKS